jgi:hypothetical protein
MPLPIASPVDLLTLLLTRPIDLLALLTRPVDLLTVLLLTGPVGLLPLLLANQLYMLPLLLPDHLRGSPLLLLPGFAVASIRPIAAMLLFYLLYRLAAAVTASSAVARMISLAMLALGHQAGGQSRYAQKRYK